MIREIAEEGCQSDQVVCLAKRRRRRKVVQKGRGGPLVLFLMRATTLRVWDLGGRVEGTAGSVIFLGTSCML